MAKIVIENGDILNGKKYAIKALNIDQKNIWYLKMVAGLYYQEKNIDSTIFYYEKAVKNFPEKEDLKLTLGNLYSEDKKYEKANSIFESFDNAYGYNKTSTLPEIRNLISETKYDEAMSKTMILLKENPDDIQSNGLLAEIYRGKGEEQKAKDVYDKLLERNPDNSAIQLSICDFLLSEKKFNDLFTFLGTVILNSKIEKGDKIALMARLIEIPEIIKDWGDKLLVSLMVLEANYSDDNIIPLLRPEFLINENRLTDASLRLEEIIKG